MAPCRHDCSLRLRAICRAIALVLTASAVSATAQDVSPGIGDTPSPRQTQRTERVEIGARAQGGTELRRNALVAKQIYGRDELDKYGDSNALDVLKRLPGVNVAGGAPRMRGLGAGYTQILINGDPAPPGFALDQLHPSQIERIEVTKAPTADQSAQAVAGSINIILKDPPRRSQRDLRLNVAYVADRPTTNTTFTLGEQVGGVAFVLPFSLFDWRGDSQVANARHQTGSDGLEARGEQAGTQAYWGTGFNLAPRVNWKPRDQSSLSANAFVQSSHWNNATDYDNKVVLGQPLFDDDTEQHGTWQARRGNLSWIDRFTDTQRIEIKAGVQWSRAEFDVHTYRDAAERLHAVGSNTERGTTQSGKYSQLLGDEHTLAAGWDLEWRRRDEARRVTDRGVPQLPIYDGQPFGARIARTAFYVQDEWEMSAHWSAYLGLRSEQIRTTSRGADIDASNTSRVVTPLLHLNYKFEPAAKDKQSDMIRASLTRSYKAPETRALLARPGLSGLYPDVNMANTALSPDSAGNPALRPELAVGLDIAWERYLAGGGLLSAGVFHRRIDDLIRNVVALEQPPWSAVSRWVSRPRNLSGAQTSGLELEVKGRAGELLPSLFDPKLALNVRGALSFYRSRVDALPGPDNRIDGQQPWAGSGGVDYRLADVPLTLGANVSWTPGYTTRQTLTQWLVQSRARSFDAFAQYAFDKSMSLRLAANNIAPRSDVSHTWLDNGDDSLSARKRRTFYSVGLDLKL